MGTDDLHPGYGSTLDGGRLPNGREVPGFLGRTDWDHVAVEIDAEIRRIAREHQERQVARTQSDRQTYGKSTLVAGEVLIDLAAVDLRQVQDTLVATIHLRVGNSRVQTINIPLASEPVIAR